MTYPRYYPPMSADRAEALGRMDASTIGDLVDVMLSDHVYVGVVVDGSAYSPSWRALQGGAEVWDRAPDDGAEAASLGEAYVDALDARVDRVLDDLREAGYGALVDGLWLGWDEGCLVLRRVDDDE